MRKEGSAVKSQEPIYDLELDRVSEFLNRLKPRVVLLQLSNGLKRYASVIVDHILDVAPDVEVFLSASHAYGACDLAEHEAERVGADAIIHVGHAMYYKPRIPTLFIEARYRLVPDKRLLEDLAEYLTSKGYNRVSLQATIQHVHVLGYVKSVLTALGLEVHVGPPGGYSRYPGHVLGCCYEPAKAVNDLVDAHVIVCGGFFHPLGLGLATGKPVISLDPFTGRFEEVTDQVTRVLRARLWKVASAFDAKRVGIVVGVKPGQYRPALASRVAREFKARKAKVVMIASDELREEELVNIDQDDVDAYVVTSCPRLPIDDLAGFRKPVLTPGEGLMAARRALDHYVFPW